LWWVAGARFFATPAPVVLFFGAAFFVVGLLVVVVVLRLRSGVVEMAAATRGLELPVAARVEAIVIVGGGIVKEAVIWEVLLVARLQWEH